MGVNVTAAHLNTTVHNLCTACFSNSSHFCLPALILASKSLLLAWFCTLHMSSVWSTSPHALTSGSYWLPLGSHISQRGSAASWRGNWVRQPDASIYSHTKATNLSPVSVPFAQDKGWLFPEGGFISAASWRTRSNMDVNKPNESYTNCDWLICCAAASWNAKWIT